jgi:hypothetical protein
MFPFMESWISRNLAHQSLLRGNQRWLRMDMYCCATLPIVGRRQLESSVNWKARGHVQPCIRSSRML